MEKGTSLPSWLTVSSAGRFVRGLASRAESNGGRSGGCFMRPKQWDRSGTWFAPRGLVPSLRLTWHPVGGKLPPTQDHYQQKRTTLPSLEEQIAQLRSAITAQEGLRPTLGDAVVEVTLTAL